ncbi:MAG: glycosyltransferase family 2 protein [Planctomycetota bacterium]|jgi:cellulose synthase/poly-beta-1,6-N-acetylglucosamine synthase-like glycosyltransferase
MAWYYHIALVVILLQLLFLLQIRNNYRYVLKTHKNRDLSYRPRTALFVPCKGKDLDFDKNITSFFHQDYEDYLLWFVVSDKLDPAYDKLCELKDRLSQSSKAHDVRVLVAGQTQSCSQKIHNLLYCYERIGDDVEVLAFADSDACIRSDWLSRIVNPLQNPRNGVTSGYRWFIPKKNNTATLAMSAMNAKIVQLLGNTRLNQAWGGSMAVRAEVFRKLGLDKIWSKTLSDDLSLSKAVKKAGMKVTFVPACLVASYQSTTWPELFEFARRQFIITRINAPRTWWLGLLSSLNSVLGLWGTVAIALYAAMTGDKYLLLFAAVPVLFFLCQMVRAIVRQKMISNLLKDDLPRMKAAMAADIFFFWLWSLLLLFLIISSAFGRTITWRQIRYKLLGPTRTIIVSRNT